MSAETPTLDFNRDKTRSISERKKVCDLRYRLRGETVWRRSDGYCTLVSVFFRGVALYFPRSRELNVPT